MKSLIIAILLIPAMCFGQVQIKKFCPVCQQLGLKSSVYEAPYTLSTLMIKYTWYDEDGNMHIDDDNIYTSSFDCSQGHIWTESTQRDSSWITVIRPQEFTLDSRPVARDTVYLFNTINITQPDTTVDIGEVWYWIWVADRSLSLKPISCYIGKGEIKKVLIRTGVETVYYIGDYYFTRNQLFRTYEEALEKVNQFLRR